MCVIKASKFDLYIEVEEREGRVGTRFMYSTDLFDAITIRRMAAHWMTLLNGITTMPDCRLGDLPLLTRAEQELMLVTWNQNARPLPEGVLYELVEERARLNPDAAAMNCEGRSWSYAELERYTGELAGRLHQGGGAAGRIGGGMSRAVVVFACGSACSDEGGRGVPSA